MNKNTLFLILALASAAQFSFAEDKSVIRSTKIHSALGKQIAPNNINKQLITQVPRPDNTASVATPIRNSRTRGKVQHVIPRHQPNHIHRSIPRNQLGNIPSQNAAAFQTVKALGDTQRFRPKFESVGLPKQPGGITNGSPRASQRPIDPLSGNFTPPELNTPDFPALRGSGNKLTGVNKTRQAYGGDSDGTTAIPGGYRTRDGGTHMTTSSGRQTTTMHYDSNGQYAGNTQTSWSRSGNTSTQVHEDRTGQHTSTVTVTQEANGTETKTVLRSGESLPEVTNSGECRGRPNRTCADQSGRPRLGSLKIRH